jgi:hypothetical protein
MLSLMFNVVTMLHLPQHKRKITGMLESAFQLKSEHNPLKELERQ